MKTSSITGKTYDETKALYMSNPTQCFRYFQYLGNEHFLDIIYTSDRHPDSLIFVWERCPETKKAKELWDSHLL